MRTLPLTILSLVLTCSLSPAQSFFDQLNGDAADEPIIAAQILILEGENIAEIADILDNIKAAGFNTVIVRVFQNHHDRYHRIVQIEDEKKYEHPSGVYFSTDMAPVVYDLITPLGRLCREKGLRLFAWMATRQMDWLDNEEWRDRAFDQEKASLVPGPKLDIFDPGFKNYQEIIFRELAKKQIDGIILQDDFVILTREGFTPDGLKAFRDFTSLDITAADVETAGFFPTYYGSEARASSKLFFQWCVFKAGYLANRGEELVKTVKSVNRDLKTGINLYYDSAVSPVKGQQWLGQDLELISSSSFDYVLSMSYHRQISRELSLGVSEAIEIVSKFNKILLKKLQSRLILKIQSIDWSTGEALPLEEVEALINSLPKGNINFAVAPVSNGGAMIKELIKIFKNRGSEVDRDEQ